MAKEYWKCPYADCKQECSRHWNMVRHIKSKHAGLGKPVKEKTLDTNQTKSDKLAQANGSSPHYRSKRPAKALEQENDLVDIVYEDVRKTKDKENKIKEIEEFFGQANTTPSNNVPMSPLELPVGFKMYTCAECFTAPIDPVKLSDFMRHGPDAFRPTHVCRQEDLEIKRQRANKGIHLDFITTWDKLRSFSIGFLANMLRQWFGPLKDVSTNVIEVDELTCRNGKLLPVELGTIGNDHWIYRASRNDKHIGSTTIDENELKAFLNLAKGTFALFRAKIKNQDKYFYAYIPPGV